MKIVVFGTGDYYHKYKKYLCESEIEAFIDNDSSKIGTKLDGIDICPVNEIKKLEYDKIVLMSVWKNEMLLQLLELGVKIQKIMDYSCIHQLVNKKKVTFDNSAAKGKKRILLVQKTCYNSGGTRALILLAQQLVRLGYSVEVCTTGGRKSVLGEFIRIGCRVHTVKYIDWTEEYVHFFHKFEIILLNTIELLEMALKLEDMGRHVILWLHESLNIYNGYVQELCKRLHSDNFIIWAVSEVAKKNFCVFNNNYVPKIVTLGIPKFTSQSLHYEKEEKMIFAVIGYFSPVKGHDVLLKALRRLTDEDSNAIEIWVIGNTGLSSCSEEEYNVIINQEMHKRKEIKLYGELGYAEMQRLFHKIDAIICPSRSETLSLAVIEGLMNKKLCIVSNAVGVADYLKDGENALIFKNENDEELYQKLYWAIHNRDKWGEICSSGLKVYQMKFSENIFYQRIVNELNKIFKVHDLIGG